MIGYYPPDHQIITGGNLDSFEALWWVLYFTVLVRDIQFSGNRELAELLGQVKPPTVSKEEIEKSGLEIIKASMLEEYEQQGRVASNCIDRVCILFQSGGTTINLSPVPRLSRRLQPRG